MPKITIFAYAYLGDILESRNLNVSTPAETVEELINFLSEQYGSSFREKLIDPKTKEMRNSYRVLINGRDVGSLKRLKTRLREGDKVLFFPPVAGG